MRCESGLVTLLLVILAVNRSIANTTTDEERLLKRLFTNYNIDSRPVINASKPVYIRFYISLIQIVDLDAENQVLKTHVWLTQDWEDERLHWNPDDFNGVQSISVSPEKVWRPDLVLYNSIKVEKSPANAVIRYDGAVIWIPSLVLQSSCKMDIRHFPFDQQKCMLKFGSWTYDGFKVDHRLMGLGVDLTDYLSHSEWELLDFKAKRNVLYYPCCDEPYIDIKVYIVIQRMPLYYGYSIIIPCFLLTILNLLVFLLPPDAGDKVSLGVTIFLAFSVFMLVIAENVPSSSISVPLLGAFLTVIMTLTSISLIMSIFILNIHHVGPHRKGVPRWLQIITHNFLSRILCLRPTVSPFKSLNENTTIADQDDEMQEEMADGNKAKDSVSTLLYLLIQKQLAEERRQKIVEEWRFVASVFDRLLFWIFLICNVVYIVLFFDTPIKGPVIE